MRSPQNMHVKCNISQSVCSYSPWDLQWPVTQGDSWWLCAWPWPWPRRWWQGCCPGWWRCWGWQGTQPWPPSPHCLPWSGCWRCCRCRWCCWCWWTGHWQLWRWPVPQLAWWLELAGTVSGTCYRFLSHLFTGDVLDFVAFFFFFLPSWAQLPFSLLWLCHWPSGVFCPVFWREWCMCLVHFKNLHSFRRHWWTNEWMNQNL